MDNSTFTPAPKKPMATWLKVVLWAFLIMVIVQICRNPETAETANTETTKEDKQQLPKMTDVMSTVRTLVKSNLKYPDSYEMQEWGNITPISDSTYVIFLKYSAKNAFGMEEHHNQLFYLKQDGSVYDVKDNK